MCGWNKIWYATKIKKAKNKQKILERRDESECNDFCKTLKNKYF